MTCISKMPSASNTLKKLLLNKKLHSSYIQREFNEKEEIINIIFSSYVEPLLKEINHPIFLQERKLNLDASAYKKIDANMYKPFEKNKLIIIIATCTDQPQ